MVKNRFFKSLYGVKIEALIAQGLDTSNAESPAVGGTAGKSTYSVTVAGTPTAGDQIILTLGNTEWHYEVGAGDTTAALFGTAILAYLNADAQSVALGLVWTKAGTTSLVLTATGPVGTALNGTPATTQAGATNAGPTFSAMSATAYTGGVNPIADQQPDYQSFIANAAAGKLGVYYDEHTSGVKPCPQVRIGDSQLSANANRRIFWAVKDANGNVYRTTSFPLGPKLLKYSKVAYNAGTNQVSTVTVVTKPSVTQILHIRITDTRLTIVPYPTYEYTAPIGGTGTAGDVETALALIVVAINTETQDPIVTATSTNDNSMVLTLTGKDGTDTFKTSAYSEGNATYPLDNSSFTLTTGTQAVQAVGTVADVAEFEKYFLVANGLVLYPEDGTLQAEWNSFGSNVVAGTQYGYLVISQVKTTIPEGGTRSYEQYERAVIAIKNADLATLASF